MSNYTCEVMSFQKLSMFLLRELIFIIFLLSSFCISTDRFSRGKIIRDGDLIISSGRKFILGFFSPENSAFRYVGIWYHGIQVQTVVWVANREHPISGNNGILKIQKDWNLVVLDGEKNVLWSTNVSISLKNATAILNDTGNLMLNGRIRSNHHQLYWQSFDYPTDTYLPAMKIYFDGRDHRITSWKNMSDPSLGYFSMGIEHSLSPQVVIWEGSKRRWRSGMQYMRTTYLYGFKVISEGNNTDYFLYTASNPSDLARFQLTWKGYEEQTTWKDDSKKWDLIIMHPQNQCDLYNNCGPFGICDNNKIPICSCLFGFTPKDFDQWYKGNWSGGCIRTIELQCNSTSGGGSAAGAASRGGKDDGFYHVNNVKLPDFVDYMGTEGNQECKAKCLKNCSCVAFTFVSGLNCMMWVNELIDIQNFEEDGNTLYLRLAHSEFEIGHPKSKVKKCVIISALVVGVVLVIASIWLLYRRREKLGITGDTTHVSRTKLRDTNGITSGDYFAGFSGEGQQCPGNELAYFSFSSVASATNNFSLKNKLGHGGFGVVYKGILPGGGEIAVKRLSKISGQGLEEFQNEVMLIARLQHRNLVNLLGCCIEGEEKILLYEYMPNKSLDSFLFDHEKQKDLDWIKRLDIIEGVARGLLYLHRDSRLRIIHRDLKASNILLDEDLSPKISDFGMARIFEGNQNEANTTRVVGTYGYMSPEYAMEGLFSMKSDVYSLGVLILEIISGRKNTSFRSADYSSIVGYAWDLWEIGRALELLDPSIADTSNRDAVLKCIHIGMLCVQDSAAHRPTMSSVMLMLESGNMDLPPPRQPTLTSMRRSVDMGNWDANQDITPSNDLTITTIAGR